MSKHRFQAAGGRPTTPKPADALELGPEELIQRLSEVLEPCRPREDIEDAGEHVTDEDLAAFVLDAETRQGVESIERHVMHCDECGELTDQLVELASSWKTQLEPLMLEAATPSQPVKQVESTAPPQRTASPKKNKKKVWTYSKYNAAQYPKEKKRLAKFALRDLGLHIGDGVFLDAGTQSTAVFNRLRRSSKEFIHVLTWNLEVVRKFSKWQEQHPKRRPFIDLILLAGAGRGIDIDHQAIYDKGTRELLMSGNYRPKAVFIGVSGIDFAQQRIEIGYHSKTDRESKELLFQIPCERRIILATNRKIGDAGTLRFNLLDVKGEYCDRPIELITLAPQLVSEDAAEASDYRRFDRARKEFVSRSMKAAIKQAGLDFSWRVADPFEDGDFNHYHIEDTLMPEAGAEDSSIGGDGGEGSGEASYEHDWSDEGC